MKLASTGAFVLPLVIAMQVIFNSGVAQAASLVAQADIERVPAVGNTAIDMLDIEWWDDEKTLLFIDVTFNFPVSVTTEITDKVQKTHILQLATTGTVAKSYKRIYSGSEHHAIPKKFRDVIEEIRYEGGGDGRANLVIYLYEPAILNYRMTNNLRTLHLEISRLQKVEPPSRPTP